MIKQFTPYLFIIMLVSCSSPESLSPEALNKYIQDADHGLVQKAEVNGYTIQVNYRPTDLLVDQELHHKPADKNEIESLRKKYGAYYYFILSLSKDNKEALHQTGGDQYSDLVQTLSFRMNNYVNLTTSATDTIPTGDFILNRTYGLSDATSLLFVFRREKAKDKEWVQFNLNEFGLNIGNQRFRFKTKDLENVPKIKFDFNR